MVKGSNFNPFVEHEVIIDNHNDTFCFFQQLNSKVPVRVVNSTKLYCVAPENYLDLNFTIIEVTLNNQNYTDDLVPYYYFKPPKIFDYNPKEGPVRGGTEVHIHA